MLTFQKTKQNQNHQKAPTQAHHAETDAKAKVDSTKAPTVKSNGKNLIDVKVMNIINPATIHNSNTIEFDRLAQIKHLTI